MYMKCGENRRTPWLHVNKAHGRLIHRSLNTLTIDNDNLSTMKVSVLHTLYFNLINTGSS